MDSALASEASGTGSTPVRRINLTQDALGLPRRAQIKFTYISDVFSESRIRFITRRILGYETSK